MKGDVGVDQMVMLAAVVIFIVIVIIPIIQAVGVEIGAAEECGGIYNVFAESLNVEVC